MVLFTENCTSCQNTFSITDMDYSTLQCFSCSVSSMSSMSSKYLSFPLNFMYTLEQVNLEKKCECYECKRDCSIKNYLREDNKRICQSCYEKKRYFFEKKYCFNCEKTKKSIKWYRVGDQNICKLCFKSSVTIEDKCTTCDTLKSNTSRWYSKYNTCGKCYYKHKSIKFNTCGICQEEKKDTWRMIDSKKACSACYYQNNKTNKVQKKIKKRGICVMCFKEESYTWYKYDPINPDCKICDNCYQKRRKNQK